MILESRGGYPLHRRVAEWVNIMGFASTHA